MQNKRVNKIRAGVAFVALCSIAIAYLAGAYSFSKNLWPIEDLRQIKRQISPPAASQPTYDIFTRLTDFPGKNELPCPAQTEKTEVLLLIGQSNAGNQAGQRYSSVHDDKVINYFGGKCFIAASPLLGTTGFYGESWTLLGNKLISLGLADRVILIPAGIGGSPIRRWKEGGDINRMLLSVLDEANSRYRITHVLWHQGEADFSDKTPRDDYVKMFISLVDSLRHKNVMAPIFPSVATKCEIVPTWIPENPVALAQRSLIDKERKIFQGVDTDSILDSKDRYDDCHFSGTGQEKFANAWVQVLMKTH